MEMKVWDELLGIVIPIVVYWVYSGLYVYLGEFEKYRLHSKKEEDEKNLVGKREVIKVVLRQQLFQAIFSIALYAVIGSEEKSGGMGSKKQSSILIVACQFFVAMVILDTWQYFMHRVLHQSKFLYKHLHSHHHRLVVPYAYGALYSHPVEGVMFDGVGWILSYFISGMSPRTSIFFFSFATIKTVDDHCGLWLPWNPFHLFFSNNTAYHDVHHQLHGTKYNFSQLFFVTWDKIFGTYMPYSLEKKVEGGFQARLVKDSKDD